MIQDTITQEKTQDILFDVIIIGGSYAGLSAALALGRALRQVLIIDSGLPCNRQTPHAHNFLTRDGSTPSELSSIALEQVLAYPGITLNRDTALGCTQTGDTFITETASGMHYQSRRVILATGIKDQLPEVPGFAECWGISVIHCPYCHGYEYHSKPTAILANGEIAIELAKLIAHWTKELYLLTNGAATFSATQHQLLQQLGITLVEAPIAALKHTQGYLEEIIFTDTTTLKVPAMYARLPFIQHSDIAAQLQCAFTEHGHVLADGMQQTSIPGVYACGDNSSGMRSVAQAVYAGSLAGAALNKDLIEEEVNSRIR